MAHQQQEENPISTLFGVVGTAVGFGYGAHLSEGDLMSALILALIGLGLGKFVGAVVFRLLLIGLVVIGFLIREQIMSTLADALFN